MQGGQQPIVPGPGPVNNLPPQSQWAQPMPNYQQQPPMGNFIHTNPKP